MGEMVADHGMTAEWVRQGILGVKEVFTRAETQMMALQEEVRSLPEITAAVHDLGNTVMNLKEEAERTIIAFAETAQGHETDNARNVQEMQTMSEGWTTMSRNKAADNAQIVQDMKKIMGCMSMMGSQQAAV